MLSMIFFLLRLGQARRFSIPVAYGLYLLYRVMVKLDHTKIILQNVDGLGFAPGDYSFSHLRYSF